MTTLAKNPVVPTDGKITLTDGTSGTAKTYEVIYEDGDFSVTGVSKDQNAVVVFKDRGRNYAARETEDQDLEFTFSAHAVGWADGTEAGLLDVVTRTGAWAAAASILPIAYGDAYMLQLAFLEERSSLGATADCSLTLKYCKLQADFAEGIPGKFTIKGTAYKFAHDANSVVWA